MGVSDFYEIVIYFELMRSREYSQSDIKKKKLKNMTKMSQVWQFSIQLCGCLEKLDKFVFFFFKIQSTPDFGCLSGPPSCKNYRFITR